MGIREIFNIYRGNLSQLSAFLAVLINPSNTININTIKIDDKYPFPANRSTFDGIREDFIKFTKYAVIRRIIEDVDILLLNLYKFVLCISLIHLSKNEERRFLRLSFNERLEKIDSILKGKLKSYKELWQSIHDVRNDLVHNNSIVKQDIINLQIPKVYSYIVIDGEKRWIPYFDDGTVSGFDISKITEYHMGVENYTKTFHKGEEIIFSNNDMKFLLSGLDWSIYQIDRIISQFIIDNGFYNLEGDKYILNIQKLKQFEEFINKNNNN